MNKPYFLIGIVLLSATATAQTSTSTTVSGAQPASSTTSPGTSAPATLVVQGVKGGNDSASSGIAGQGSNPSITAGDGGDGTGSGATSGGTGGSLTLATGNGGASVGAANGASGGNMLLNVGAAGSVGTGAAGGNGAILLSVPNNSSNNTEGGTYTYPLLCGPTVQGLCLYWIYNVTDAFYNVIAWRDCTGSNCPAMGNQVSGGLDDQGVRIASGNGSTTGGGAIRFAHNGITGNFNDGGIMSNSAQNGTLSLCMGSDCNGATVNPHSGNLNLANLNSYGTVTFNDGSTVGSSGFSYGTGYSGIEWITQPIGTATGNTLSGTANQMTLWGVVLPFPITTSNVSWNITTADNSAHTYDLCLYNSAGTLQVHIGSTPGTTFANTASGHNGSWTSSSIVLQPGIYYEGLTSSCTTGCATLGGTNANGVTFLTNTTVSVTSGGTCPNSITPPSNAYVFNASIPALIVR